ITGTLATHWIADSLTLWKSPLTDSHLFTSAAYYSILAKAPFGMGVAIGAVAFTGSATTLWSLWDGRAGNLMFDGASFFLYGIALCAYIFTVIPNLTEHFTSPLALSATSTFPTDLRTPTLDLASSNLVCSVALTGVLVLQAGRWWAEGEDDTAMAVTASSLHPRTRRRRSGTPTAEVDAPPPNPRVNSKRRDGSIRRKRLGSTSSGSTANRRIIPS
ncbi:ER membrane protein SH3-domain-containing protein, partial [Hysterangium stoloniferum]